MLLADSAVIREFYREDRMGDGFHLDEGVVGENGLCCEV